MDDCRITNSSLSYIVQKSGLMFFHRTLFLINWWFSQRLFLRGLVVRLMYVLQVWPDTRSPPLRVGPLRQKGTGSTKIPRFLDYPSAGESKAETTEFVYRSIQYSWDY